MNSAQSKSSNIRDVWRDNVEAEFRLLRELIVEYPYIAMDTEFPGVVAKPVGNFKTTQDYYYSGLHYNVNLLKMIQLGITLLNERGEVPDPVCTWQFNFKFSLQSDVYAPDSIELLKNGGIDFDLLSTHGIDPQHFAELLISSGMVLMPEVKWVAFHSGYDFAYLLRMATGQQLPEKLHEFASMFQLYFPSVIDIKNLLRHTQALAHTLGLDALADILCVRRIGTAHQAGSDSLLTGHCYFKILRDYFESNLPGTAMGLPYGLYDDSDSGARNLQPSGSPTTLGLPATPTGGSVGGVGAGGRGPPAPLRGGVQDDGSGMSPSQNVNSAFPSTPAMRMVMHGGNAQNAHYTNE
jgi:CCR4-NOT transcription complex subunit 7/8